MLKLSAFALLPSSFTCYVAQVCVPTYAAHLTALMFSRKVGTQEMGLLVEEHEESSILKSHARAGFWTAVADPFPVASNSQRLQAAPTLGAPAGAARE